MLLYENTQTKFTIKRNRSDRKTAKIKTTTTLKHVFRSLFRIYNLNHYNFEILQALIKR